MLKTSVFRVCGFAAATLLCSSLVAAEDDRTLPPILDYYPNCAYHLIKTYKVGKKSVDPQSPDIIFKVLQKLREEAKQVGADALILVDKRLQQISHPSSTNERQPKNSYRLSYQAELIKNCQGVKSGNRKLAAYNHEGKLTLRDISTTIYRPPIELALPAKRKLNHPKILNAEVSISQGVYGLTLGSSYLEVLETLGDPSAELILLDEELIIAYGRRHWLRFQDNKLVKVHNHSQFLSSTILNSLPLRDFFDDYEWKINNQIAYQSTLASVRESLHLDQALDKDGQLTIRKNGAHLILHFENAEDPVTGKKLQRLNDFTLQADTYQQRARLPEQVGSGLYQAIEKAYLSLQQEQDIDWPELEKNLPQALGTLTLSVDEKLRIYSDNVLLTSKRLQLTLVHFIEQAFLPQQGQKAAQQPWYLGKLVQGKSLTQLEPYFLQDAFVFGSEVEMEAEKYTLSLYFEDLAQRDSLYEAKLVIH